MYPQVHCSAISRKKVNVALLGGVGVEPGAGSQTFPANPLQPGAQPQSGPLDTSLPLPSSQCRSGWGINELACVKCPYSIRYQKRLKRTAEAAKLTSSSRSHRLDLAIRVPAPLHPPLPVGGRDPDPLPRPSPPPPPRFFHRVDLSSVQ